MNYGLSRREREIVEILYASGEASAADVRHAMSGEPSDATVRTLLRILLDKGFVKHRLDGRRYLYRPVQAKSGAGKSALKRVLDVFYGGNVEEAFAAHLADPKIKLTAKQIQRLHDLIDHAAQQEKR
ncbi:MAG: BlaI/MecI/CopY family transcriptional regulator [Planctomycetaceae bacterium]